MSSRLRIARHLATAGLATAGLAGVAGCSKSQDKSPSELSSRRDQPAVVVVGADELQGTSMEEVEPNEESPQKLPMDVGVAGTLNGAKDVDRYQIALPEAGRLVVKLGGAPDADLKLALRNGEGKELALSDRGPAGTSEGLAGFALAAGTYELVVDEYIKKRDRKVGGRQGQSQPYRLHVNLLKEPEDGLELEDNSVVEGASEIAAGEERLGYIGWARDTDLWRLPVAAGDVEVGEGLSKPGLDIVVTGVPGASMQLSLLSAEGEVLDERESGPGEEVALRGFIPDVAAESYLLKLYSKRSNPVDRYSLRVEETTIAPGSEVEPNATMELATPLAGDDDQLIHGKGELCGGDVDMFLIPPAASNRVLDLQAKGPADTDIDVAVIAASGAVLGASESEGAGKTESLSSVNIPPNTSPVVRVTGKSIKTPAPYSLSLSLLPGVAPPPPPPPPPSRSSEAELSGVDEE